MTIVKTLTFLTVFICSTYLSSCGYSIHRHSELPFYEIAVGHIENKTFEPKLQDKLHRALTEEFLKQGIRVKNRADLKLTGIIHTFTMTSLSEKEGITVEYRVDVQADFRLVEDNGTVREFNKIASPFIVSFKGAEDFGVLLANRDRAEEEAVKDIAMQVVGALIYQ